jgi:hypothetical protein
MKSIRMSRIFKIAILIIVILLNFSVESNLSADDINVDRHDSKIQNPGPPVINFPTEKVPEGIDSTCTAWTDGCRACGCNPDGIFCSNEGIACRSFEMHCVRHE